MGAAMIYGQQFGAQDAVAIAGFTKLLRNLDAGADSLAALSMRGSAEQRQSGAEVP
jgi:hypothetical protein